MSSSHFHAPLQSLGREHTDNRGNVARFRIDQQALAYRRRTMTKRGGTTHVSRNLTRIQRCVGIVENPYPFRFANIKTWCNRRALIFQNRNRSISKWKCLFEATAATTRDECNPQRLPRAVRKLGWQA